MYCIFGVVQCGPLLLAHSKAAMTITPSIFSSVPLCFNVLRIVFKNAMRV